MVEIIEELNHFFILAIGLPKTLAFFKIELFCQSFFIKAMNGSIFDMDKFPSNNDLTYRNARLTLILEKFKNFLNNEIIEPYELQCSNTKKATKLYIIKSGENAKEVKHCTKCNQSEYSYEYLKEKIKDFIEEAEKGDDAEIIDILFRKTLMINSLKKDHPGFDGEQEIFYKMKIYELSKQLKEMTEKHQYEILKLKELVSIDDNIQDNYKNFIDSQLTEYSNKVIGLEKENKELRENTKPLAEKIKQLNDENENLRKKYDVLVSVLEDKRAKSSGSTKQ